MERLYSKGYVSDPKSKTKSVVLSEEGEKRSGSCSQAFLAETLDLAQTELLTRVGRKPNPGQGRIGDESPGTHRTLRYSLLISDRACLAFLRSSFRQGQRDSGAAGSYGSLFRVEYRDYVGAGGVPGGQAASH